MQTRSSTDLQILLHPDLILAVAGSELSLLLHGQPHILGARKSVPVRQCRVLSLLRMLSEVTTSIQSMPLILELPAGCRRPEAM